MCRKLNNGRLCASRGGQQSTVTWFGGRSVSHKRSLRVAGGRGARRVPPARPVGSILWVPVDPRSWWIIPSPPCSGCTLAVPRRFTNILVCPQSQSHRERDMGQTLRQVLVDIRFPAALNRRQEGPWCSLSPKWHPRRLLSLQGYRIMTVDRERTKANVRCD
jgi:hypothetical protein